jgi:DNA transposition AAA+ family ATPase
MDRREEQIGHRVADELAREAQAKEARMLPTTGAIAPEQMAHAIAKISGYIKERSLTLKQVSDEIGYGQSTISSVLSGKYNGDNDKLVRIVYRWMIERPEKHRAGMPTGFVSTKVADRMLAIIGKVRETGTMGAVVGPSGASKSMVAQVACAKFPGTALFELSVAHKQPGSIMNLMVRHYKVRGRRNRMADQFEILVDHLCGTNRLILIDEAHFMSRDACTIVRDLHKQTGCPIVLIGTRDVLDTINDFDAFRGQFQRLFSFIYNITDECQSSGDPMFTVAEVAEFASSMKLRLAGDAVEFLTDLTNCLGWGGLGSASMLLLLAKVLAQGKTIHRKHLREALRQSAGASGFEQVQVRMSTKKVRVA